MLFVIDIGTTSLKAALFDTTGVLQKSASVPIGFVKADNPSYHEVDPRQWVSAAGRAFREVSGGERVDVEAIAVSGNGPTLVPVDGSGEPIGNAMSWMDRRGVREAEEIRNAAGYYVDPTFYLPKALWVRSRQPEVFARVAHFMACPEFMIYRLTGKAHTILPGDDFLRYFWTDKLLDDLGLAGDLFPAFIDPGTFCGTVRKQASEETGIPEGIPVFAGGPDFIMSMLGTASVFPGRACDRAGTSEGINLCTADLVRDDRLLGYGHVIKGLYNVSGIISTSGKALEWTLGLLGMSEDYPEVFSQASQSLPGAKGLLFLPYLAGERAPHWDPALRASFFGLSLFHRRRDLLRAVLESVGFAIRDVIAAIEDNGLEVKDLRITGNPSRSGLWNTIKADISGKSIMVPECPESELLGDACIALYGTGRYDSLQKAADETVRFKEKIDPDPENREVYDRMFGIYRSLNERTVEAAHALSEIQNTEGT